MAEFSVNGFDYRSSKMDALTQLHVVRRLSPVIGALREFAVEGVDATKALDALEPVAMVVAKIPDDDVNYIVNACLSTVQRKQDGDRGWANIWNSGAKRPLFEDIAMVEMLTISGHVIMDALGNFSLGRLQG